MKLWRGPALAAMAAMAAVLAWLNFSLLRESHGNGPAYPRSNHPQGTMEPSLVDSLDHRLNHTNPLQG